MDSQAIEQIPLHTVADILAGLDNFQQLGSAVLSHRIFVAALNDNRHPIACGILKNQVPDNLLPFAIALHESAHVDPGDHEAVTALLRRMKSAILNPAEADATLWRVGTGDAAAISRNHAAIEALTQDLVEETIPVFNKRLCQAHSTNLLPKEKFRIGRAFYRYQIACNLFCSEAPRAYPDDELRTEFFEPFSHWVNEQLACTYGYLERKLGEAFAEVAAYDIQWGKLLIDWTDDASGNPHLQHFLCRGLPFLSAVSRARDFDERRRLLDLSSYRRRSSASHPFRQLSKMVPDPSPTDPLALINTENTEQPEDSTNPRMSDLATAFNGKHDSIGTCPFYMWSYTHLSITICDTVFCKYDRNLWECGYVFWECTEAIYSYLWNMAQELRNSSSWFKSPEKEWSIEEVAESMKRRADIYNAGGEGYWPRYGLDFSRVQNLDGMDKLKLMKTWRNERGYFR